MEEILENAREFLASGEDNLLKNRFNASVSDFFKAITNFCDYIIYRNQKVIVKNHNERFELLKKYYPEIYANIFSLFKKYRDSYNLRLVKGDALELRKYAYELKNNIPNKI